MKAYVVREPEEGHCCLVFAATGVAARRLGANELNIDFGEVDSCTRAYWADQYAPGPVPIQALVEHGWWYECMCGCGRRIDNDEGQHNIDADGADGELNPMDPVYVAEGVYWNKVCVEEERLAKEIRARAQAEVKAATLSKFPFATNIKIVTPYRPRKSVALSAEFNAPGCHYPIAWVIGEPFVRVMPTDVDAWNALHTGNGTG